MKEGHLTVEPGAIEAGEAGGGVATLSSVELVGAVVPESVDEVVSGTSEIAEVEPGGGGGLEVVGGVTAVANVAADPASARSLTSMLRQD